MQVTLVSIDPEKNGLYCIFVPWSKEKFSRRLWVHFTSGFNASIDNLIFCRAHFSIKTPFKKRRKGKCAARLLRVHLFYQHMTKSLENFDFWGFFVVNFDFLCGPKCGSTVWPTLWPTRWKSRKVSKSAGQGVCASCPAFFAILHDLLHEVSHGLGGFVLLLPCCMSVGAEGEAGVEVSQHGGDRFHIHAVL